MRVKLASQKYRVFSKNMNQIFTPSSTEEISAIVLDAVSARTPLEVLGNGTRRNIGRPMNTQYCLSTSALTDLLLYEPDELVVRAQPGMTVADLRAELDQRGQMLAFEPPDWGPLMGMEPEKGTIGGIIAGNLSGPRRIKMGAARDHFLGVEAVSGRGELFKSGGRVVKNVTGYDLCKLLAGSWGTLGIMTEITLKVLPAPEKTRTLLIGGNNVVSAVSALTEALSSPHDVSGAAWVPKTIAKRSAIDFVSGAGTDLAAIRIEGIGSSAIARCTALREMLANYGQIEELHTHNSVSFWREIQDVRLFPTIKEEDVIWRISIAPSGSVAVLNELHTKLDIEAFLDWGGGLIWVYIRGSANLGSDSIRSLISNKKGHATLIRGSAGHRSDTPVFQPEPGPIKDLTRKLKNAFDPHDILNPGRMFEGV